MLRRADHDAAAIGVDDHGVARRDIVEDFAHRPDRRDVERAGDQRHMGGRPAFFEHDRANARTVLFQQISRSKRSREQHQIVADVGWRVGRMAVRPVIVGEVPQQALG